MNYKQSTMIEMNFQALVLLTKGLSDENRLQILLSVSNGKKSVSQIVQELKLSQPLVSHHLKELRHALLVKVERNGPFVYYEIADARILEILEKLNTLAEFLIEERKFF